MLEPLRHVEVGDREAIARLRDVSAPCCVSVRAALANPAENDARFDALLESQARAGHPLYLVTGRGTIAAHPPTLLEALGSRGALRVCLDLDAWAFGCEALLGDAAEWDALLGRIAPHVDVVVGGRGGSERQGTSRTVLAPLLSALTRRRFRAARRLTEVHVLETLPNPESP